MGGREGVGYERDEGGKGLSTPATHEICCWYAPVGPHQQSSTHKGPPLASVRDTHITATVTAGLDCPVSQSEG